MENKTCIICKNTKELTEFYKNREECGKTYYQSYCKICQKKMLQVRHVCDCGRTYTSLHRQRHFNTNVHKRNIKVI